MKYYTVCLMLFAVHAWAQSPLPYQTIPEYPETYTAGTVASRLIDGLGFRFYWATDSLSQKDIDFRPGEEVRSVGETVHHIYEMSVLVYNTIHPDEKKSPQQGLSFQQQRAEVLGNLYASSMTLRAFNDEDFARHNIVFKSGAEYPFWNLINGPIADAVWHCGQIVSFRRSAGNPFNSKVSVFNGKLRN